MTSEPTKLTPESINTTYAKMSHAMSNAEELSRLLAEHGVSEPYRAQAMMKLTAQAVDAASSATYDLLEAMELQIAQLQQQLNEPAHQDRHT